MIPNRIKETIFLLFSVLISCGLMFHANAMNSINLMYAILSATLINITLFSIKSGVLTEWFWFILSLTWYASYWTVRNLFSSAETLGTDFDNFISLAPIIVMLFYLSFGRKEIVLYLILLSVHYLLVYLMKNTDNELVLFLLATLFSKEENKDMRIILCGFIWCQAFLVASKYKINAFPEGSIVYLIALLPYHICLMLVLLRRIFKK